MNENVTKGWLFILMVFSLINGVSWHYTHSWWLATLIIVAGAIALIRYDMWYNKNKNKK